MIRNYPLHKVKNGSRYILLKGEHLRFPQEYHYYQYLIAMLFIIIRLKPDTNYYEKSIFHRMLIDHIKRMTTLGDDEGFEATNNEVYLYSVASDLELLFIEDSLDKDILKRLRSSDDGELRGVIYEVSVAAAFVRIGYSIEWLRGTKLPEFIASKNGSRINVEAKRRNRTSTAKNEYDVDREVRAMRQLVWNAQQKERTGSYLIFIDTDLPPKTSGDNAQIYEKLSIELQKATMSDVVILLTNSGYEHDRENVSNNNSGLIIKKESTISHEVLDLFIESFHADLPDAISDKWKVD